MLALLNSCELVVENGELAARKPRRVVSAGKSKTGICLVKRTGRKVRRIVVGINCTHWLHNRFIRRERGGDYFVSTNESAGDAAVESVNKPAGISLARTLEERGLFHRTPDFSAARKFGDVIDATTEFLFGIGASGSHQSDARE